MYRSLAVFFVASIGVVAAAQTVNGFKGEASPQPMEAPTPSARGDAPRVPTENSPEKTVSQPAGSGNGGADCHVERADTDTGFVVVCEERDGG